MAAFPVLAGVPKYCCLHASSRVRPVPVSAMSKGDSSASLLARCSTALRSPVAPGVKRTVKVTSLFAPTSRAPKSTVPVPAVRFVPAGCSTTISGA